MIKHVLYSHNIIEIKENSGSEGGTRRKLKKRVMVYLLKDTNKDGFQLNNTKVG